MLTWKESYEKQTLIASIGSTDHGGTDSSELDVCDRNGSGQQAVRWDKSIPALGVTVRYNAGHRNTDTNTVPR